MLAQRNLQLRLFASDCPGVASAYEKFVEGGGPPAVNRIKDFISGVFNTSVLLNELLDIGTSADTAYDGLASAIIITREEWNALPSLARGQLSEIAPRLWP